MTSGARVSTLTTGEIKHGEKDLFGEKKLRCPCRSEGCRSISIQDGAWEAHQQESPGKTMSKGSG